MTSTTSQLMATDGLGLLVRRWTNPDPQLRMLIVHGIAEHSGRWEQVGEFFSERGIDTTAFDLRGHGASGGARVDLESFDEFLQDVEQVLAEIPRDVPRVIYGHSMGGVIAASYAVSDRVQPDLLVLSAPALQANVPAPLRLAAKVVSRVRPEFRMENSISGDQLSRDPAVGEKYFSDPLVTTRATARFGALFFAQMEFLNANFSRLRLPTLVIHGADDVLVPPAASAPLASLENVERKLFAGLRHEIHNEPERDEVLGFVDHWLRERLA